MAGKYTGLIIAKTNSGRVPYKSIKPLGGKALINHPIDTMRLVPEISDIVVFCSDPNIRHYINTRDYTFLARPKELDEPGITEVEIYDEFIKLYNPEYIVACWCTNPFTKATTLKNMIDKVDSGEFDSAVAMVPTQDRFWFKGKPLNHCQNPWIPSSKADPLYYEAGTAKVFHSSLHVNERKRIADNHYVEAVDIFEGLDIDTRKHWLFAELVVEYLKSEDSLLSNDNFGWPYACTRAIY